MHKKRLRMALEELEAGEYPGNLLTTMAKAGERQLICLGSLCSHGGWPGGWIWDGPTTTARILEGLVKRGLAVKVPVPKGQSGGWGEFGETRVRYQATAEVKTLHDRLDILRRRTSDQAIAERRESIARERYETGADYRRVRELIVSAIDHLEETAKGDERDAVLRHTHDISINLRAANRRLGELLEGISKPE